MVWYGMVWYGMVWYGMVWYGMVWYGMVWYGMVWYGMVWYGMVHVVLGCVEFNLIKAITVSIAYKPTQFLPSPVYPSLQVHLISPGAVSVHVANS
jgi:hypothetical protein